MNARDTNTGKSIKNRNVLKRFWSSFGKIGRKVYRVVVGRTLPQRLFRLYIIIIIIGALLLCAPFSLKPIIIDPITHESVLIDGFHPQVVNGVEYNFVTALFIACSGFSDTGLTPVNVYEYLSGTGQAILLILIELGGIGVITLFYFVWNFFKKKQDKIDVGQLYIMQAERGGSRMAESFHVLKVALIFMLSTQIVFMFIYSLCFCFIPAYIQEFPKLDMMEGAVFDGGISYNSLEMLPMYHNYPNSLWVGLFTTVSALNNAGFDNISFTSMAPFRNDIGILVQTFLVIELIVGGLGHFVWFEVIEKIKCTAIHKKYTMSLYSKVAIVAYVIVAVLGIFIIFIGEWTDPTVQSCASLQLTDGSIMLEKEITIFGNSNSHGEFGNNPMMNKVFAVIFHSFNARSMGMETVKTDVLGQGTMWGLSLLMFIGASPCSAAGGIRTTTLAVIIITIWCRLCGRKNVFFFKRRISQSTVEQSFMIFIISLVLLMLGVVILWSATPIPPAYRDSYNLWFNTSEYVVECASAFGTVGLSTGITSATKWWGLVYLVFLMFVGQLGVINTLLSWTRFHPHFNDIEYPYEDIKIG